MTFPRPADGQIVVARDAPPEWPELARSNRWNVVDAEALSDDPWSLEGTIVTVTDIATAGLVLARSGSISLAATVVDDLEALHHDARRVGARLWPSPEPVGPVAANGDEVDDIAPETAALLATLATGASVADAARANLMSLRTAQRRLGSARATFGVATTSGAVSAWSRRNDGSIGGRQ